MTMNKHIIIAVILAAMLGLTAFQCSKSNEDDQSQHLCGAYTEQRAISDEELVLFSNVIGTIDTVTEYTPVSVSTQVVAGLNYKFRCLYDDKNGSSGECFVIIYMPLQGDPELTGIEKL